MVHNPLRCDCGHVFVSLVDALAPLKPEREGDRAF
jgi:hypothetical protein